MGKTAGLRDRATAVFDAALLAAGAVLYTANNALVKPLHLPGSAGAFFGGHFNDVVAGFAFLTYTNLLFDLVKPSKRLRRLWVAALYGLLCGLFWEVIAPVILRPSVSDPWDLASYVLGACGYWLVDALRRGDLPGARRL